MERIYLDYAATTYVDQEVMDAALPYFSEVFGNASSQHTFGQDGAKAVERARMIIAEEIGAKPSEIYFTSGGTESDNTAIKGVAFSKRKKGKHVITTAIEHPAVLNSCRWLERNGYEVTYLSVNGEGQISLDELKSSIREDTVLISVMTANNEIGSIQPIAEVGRIARENGIVFHTDAVQAFTTVKVDVNEMNIDLMSMSAHKIYGMKGVGALYIRNGVKVDKFMSGGEQERNTRAGTHNTPAIVAFGKATEIASRDREANNAKISALRDYMKDEIERRIPEVRFNGGFEKRLPNNLSVSFRYVEGEAILLRLDLDGIAASSGSACSSGSLLPSHVLLAIGVPVEESHGTIRFTVGKSTTKEEIDYAVDKLENIIKELRYMSPLFNQVKGESKNV